MIISSWSVAGYAVGLALSKSGKVNGPWQLLDEPLYPENGGHGMFFKTVDDKLAFTLHFPNDKYAERPHFWYVNEGNDTLTLSDEI